MTSIYIATTALSELWSRSDPVLLLGPWCRQGVETFTPANYEELPCIWEEENSITQAEAFCWDVFRRWTPPMGEILNSIHQVEHSTRYWEILLSVWFLHFINVTYDRYHLLRSAARSAPNCWTTVTPRQSYTVAPTSFSAIKRSAYDHAYNLQLFSEAARFVDIAAAENGPIDWKANGTANRNGTGGRENIRRMLGAARSGFLRTAITAANRLSLIFAGSENDLTLYLGGHYSWSDLWSLSRPAGARTIFPGHGGANGAAGARPSLEARARDFERLDDAKAEDRFERLVLSSAPYFIPTCFVEGYGSLAAESRKRFGTEPEALIFDSPTLYDDPFFLEYAARCAEAGKKIVSIQHGGAYGHTRSSPAERIELDLCDGFISFGWKDERFPEKTLPLPNPHLSSLKRSARPGEAILYISFFGKTYLHRLVSVPHASQWDDYLEGCEKFLEGLTPESLSRVRFRAYFGYGMHRLPPLMESLMKSDRREKRFASRALADCRLAVIDHASTSWIEALACNTPTILFWNPSHWKFRPAAKPLLEALAGAGVLYFDPEAAARKVDEIYDQAEDWWGNKEIQSARRAFCERYAWAAPDWRNHWVRALKGLSAS